MKKGKCLFCMIAKGKVPSYKIYEDRKYVAILDLFPNIKGQTLVLPKRHFDSYAFALSDKTLSDFVLATKKVALLIQKRLKAGRVHMVIEGTGVNHLHAKLYPAIGTDEKFKQAIAEERMYFESYPGYVTTLMGPQASESDLRFVQKMICGKKQADGSVLAK